MNKIKKIVSVVIAMSILLSLSACGSREEPTEYRFANYYKYFLGQPYYENIIKAQEPDTITIDKKYGDNAYFEGDYFIVQANDEQRDALIQQNEKLLEQAGIELKAMKEDYDVNVSEDFSLVEFYLDDTYFSNVFSEGAFELGGNLLSIISIVLSNRVLLTGDCDVCIDVSIINLNSQHIVADALFPYEKITIRDTDWTNSETSDVELSSAYEGYTMMDAVIKSIDEQKIVFAPIATFSLYPEDQQLELCFDSVYADEVYFPYDLEVDMEVQLLLDGMYALHEDGDAIPDIAPAAMIPKKYVK